MPGSLFNCGGLAARIVALVVEFCRLLTCSRNVSLFDGDRFRWFASIARLILAPWCDDGNSSSFDRLECAPPNWFELDFDVMLRGKVADLARVWFETALLVNCCFCCCNVNVFGGFSYFWKLNNQNWFEVTQINGIRFPMGDGRLKLTSGAYMWSEWRTIKSTSILLGYFIKYDNPVV